ncbi:MAG: hypothetical protein ACI37T_09650 [Candidatus Gastranaerophilaceae bacterium]
MPHIEAFKKENLKIDYRYTRPHVYNLRRYKLTFRKMTGKSKKRPIVFCGCSYTYGSFLKNTQTLAYKVHQLTQRTVYKRGVCGGSINQILEQLTSGVLKKEVPDAEYLIYVYIISHIDRLFFYQIESLETYINNRYEIKNGKLVKIENPKLPYLYSLFTVKYFQQIIAGIRADKEFDDDIPLFKAIMTEIMNQLKKQYPNSKYVILMYPESSTVGIERGKEQAAATNKIVKDYCEKLGFWVIDAEDLTQEPIRNSEYRCLDVDHPNERAWDIIAPALVKKLNL